MNPIPTTRVIGGRYIVLAELGRGGMGIVWRAEDRVMGRQVAVKELHLPQGLSPDERRLFRERLLREARNAGRLNDPGIVTVHDVVSDAGVDHIVMELIEARTLSDVVAGEGPLDERAASAVAQQLLGALNAAHAAAVVHRDVKPSNVMLGPGGRVKLTDFGIAQAADDPRLTTSGSMVGSPGYMAPERLDGGAASPASDLWALGATLYYAVAGSSPFTRDTTSATIAAVLNGDVPTLRTRGPLGTVVAGLLQRSPQARLSGMQAAALLASRAPGGDTATVTSSPPAPQRRRRWVWPVAALVLGLVVGVAGTLLVRPGTSAIPVLTYGSGGDLPVFDVTSLSCVQGQLVAGHQFSSSSTTSCDSPHELEVFHDFTPFGSTQQVAYPGRDALASFANAACTLAFGSGGVLAPGKESLRSVGLIPSEAAFSFRETPTSGFSTRDVVCVLEKTDGSQLTDSRVAPDSN